MRDVPRETPWGTMTYLEYRHRVEFGEAEYLEIAAYAMRAGSTGSRRRGMSRRSSSSRASTSSPTRWRPPRSPTSSCSTRCAHRQAGDPVDGHVDDRRDRPCGRVARHRQARHDARHLELSVPARGGEPAHDRHPAGPLPGVPIGYSGHERGLQISLAAVTLGAVAVERHITLDRAMWGSDQAASLEPTGSRAPGPRHPRHRATPGRRRQARLPRRGGAAREAASGARPVSPRFLVLADSDSYVKWGAAFASRLPAGWRRARHPGDARGAERAAAARGARRVGVRRVRRDLPRTARARAAPRARAGPTSCCSRCAVRSCASSRRSSAALPTAPVLVSGFPGLTIPAEPKAIIYREQVDLIVLQSRREVREFRANAEELGIPVGFGLTTLPFLSEQARADVPGAGLDAPSGSSAPTSSSPPRRRCPRHARTACACSAGSSTPLAVARRAGSS